MLKPIDLEIRHGERVGLTAEARAIVARAEDRYPESTLVQTVLIRPMLSRRTAAVLEGIDPTSTYYQSRSPISI